MDIRSITVFLDLTYPLDTSIIAQAGQVLREASEALTEQGFPVQSKRIATQPFPEILVEQGPNAALDLAKDLEALCFVHEIDYLSIGPVRYGDETAYIEVIPDIFEVSEKIFATVEVANPQVGISLPRLRRCAHLIHHISQLREDGFSSLRFAATANVAPGTPFFPAAYHAGGVSMVGIAAEATSLTPEAIGGAKTIAEAQRRLVRSIETYAEQIETTVASVLRDHPYDYLGADFSMAPFPDATRSTGGALEAFGLPAVGQQGSVAAAAFLASALDQAEFKRTGLNGLMLAVLEDTVLGQRVAEGHISISELLLFSTVCGTGLDTIPVPGDMTDDAITSILLDMAVLALRLDKPLTARLMPIPGVSTGQPTSFEFDYFANTQVMTVDAEPLRGLLAGDETIPMIPRWAYFGDDAANSDI